MCGGISQYDSNSQAVQKHLEILQAVIQRMASNSTSCKTWCITLVSAIIVLVADKGKPDYALIAAIPAILFLALDTYYLALERMFRASYNSFINKLHSCKVNVSDLYVVTQKGNLFITFLGSLSSFSIWPFYVILMGMILIAKTFVMANT